MLTSTWQSLFRTV